MTPEEIVAMCTALRAAGVSHYVSADFKCKLLPPAPTPLDNIREGIAEMQPELRKKLLKEAEEDLDRDLYGASRG